MDIYQNYVTYSKLLLFTIISGTYLSRIRKNGCMEFHEQYGYRIQII